ncbi:MAG: (d)CMP kinase, partial [Omnitrophica bacterium]|nr:(d)CMP kinase [Candidatus Omnitrophota bacterium]
MAKSNIIAIDGPAGSGKSTVAKSVATRLGILYVDTGAMYRALTLKAINEGLDFSDKNALVELSKSTHIDLEESESSLKVYLDKDDVTEKIRTMEVTKAVKFLASVCGVRENMVRLQRALSAASSGAVLEGRDIGTVVFPHALHKFYLDASFETRTKRRFDELKAKGFDITLQEVKDDVMSRDKSDMAREAGPLKKAEDATVVNTTGMTVTQVVDKIMAEIRRGKKG